MVTAMARVPMLNFQYQGPRQYARWHNEAESAMAKTTTFKFSLGIFQTPAWSWDNHANGTRKRPRVGRWVF